MCQYKKIANLAVKDGTYIKDGKERNRYQNVGCIVSTPHGSNMFIKLNATADHDARALSIFLEDGIKLKVEEELPKVVTASNIKDVEF